MTTQLYLQSFGHVDLELKGKEKQHWRARALTKIVKSNPEVDESREESLQIVLQNRHKFAYVDLDTIQLSKAVKISEISKRCHAFSLARDGWSLFGIKEKQRPRFVALTKNFQEVKYINPPVEMIIKKQLKTNQHRCALYRLHKRFVQLYSRFIPRSKRVRYKDNKIFPHISSSSNGLAVLCAREPGCCYIWEYHRGIGMRWDDVDHCDYATIPGVWRKVFQNKLQIEEWFLQHKSARVESRIFFNDKMKIAGAIAFISLTLTHINFLWAPIAKEGSNYFFKFSPFSIDIRNLRAKSAGPFSYIARLNTTGDRIVVGINIPYNSYICSFPLAEDELLAHSAPISPLSLCHHCHIGLSVYDMSNPKYCCIVDIQWIANDKTFAVMTNCGSLAIFNSKVEPIVTSILSDCFYIQPAIYHQIFQKSHHPHPTAEAYQTIRPPKLEYWGALTFSMFWSAQQNILICSSGKSIVLFSIVHAENLPDRHISQNDIHVVKELKQNDLKAHSDVTKVWGISNEADMICPSDVANVSELYSKSLADEKSNLLKTVQTLASNMPEPHITIRPVKVDVTQQRSFPMLPIHFEFHDNILLPSSSYTISETQIPPTTIEDSLKDLDENERTDKRPRSLPDLHSRWDFENFADDEFTTSEYENTKKENDINGNESQLAHQNNAIHKASVTEFSFKNKELRSVALQGAIIPSQIQLTIPKAPEIHTLVRQTNCTRHEDDQMPSKDSSTQTSLPNTPKNSSNHTLFRHERIATPSLTCMREEYYRNHDLIKPLVMVKLQPFERLSEVLTGETSNSESLSSHNFHENLAADKIALEIAQRKIAATMKARDLAQKLFEQMKERLHDLKTRSEILRVNTAKKMESKTLLQPNRKVKSATSNEVEKTSSILRSNRSVDSVGSKKTKSVSWDLRKQSDNKLSCPKKQNMRNVSQRTLPDNRDYSDVYSKVNTFNLPYIARLNSNSRSKTSINSTSNPKLSTTVKSNSEKAENPRKVSENLKNNQQQNKCSNSKFRKGDNSTIKPKKSENSPRKDEKVNNSPKTHQTKPRTQVSMNSPRTPGSTNSLKELVKQNNPPTSEFMNKRRLRDSTSTEESKQTSKNTETKTMTESNEKQWSEPPKRIPVRGHFTNDGEKRFEEMTENDGNETESDDTSSQPRNENCVLEPPTVIQATNKWVQSKTMNPEGCDKVSKSGARFRSWADSLLADTLSLSSTLLSNPHDCHTTCSDNEGKSHQGIHQFNIEYEKKKKTQKSDINENFDLVQKDEIRTLEIEEEEGENIPLRSILSQSPKKCGRKVSFCEPIALYRSASTNALKQKEVKKKKNCVAN